MRVLSASVYRPRDGRNHGRSWLRAVSVAALFLGNGALVPFPATAQDGFLDPTFSGDGYTDFGFPNPPEDEDRFEAIAAQPDGRILIAGRTCAQYFGGDCTMMVVRLRSDGSLDPQWGGDGMIPLSFGFFPDADDQLAARILHLPSSGKILVAGTVVDSHLPGDRLGLLRLNSNGTLDSTFGGNGTGKVVHFLPGAGYRVTVTAAVAAGTFLYVGGHANQTGFTDQDYFIARFTTNGELDSTYNGGVGVRWIAFDQGQDNDDMLAEIAVQSDGKVVAVGQISDSTAGDHDTGFVRLDRTGLPDLTFGSGGAIGTGKVIWQRTDTLFFKKSDIPVSVVLQPDGRILFSGSYSLAGQPSDSVWYFGRLLSDGMDDPDLTLKVADVGPGSDFDPQMQLQSDGKIVLAGTSGSTVQQGGPWCSAARFVVDSNGATLDQSFGTGGAQRIAPAFWQFFCQQAVLSGGRLVIGGFGAHGGNDFDLFVMRWTSALVFSDGFASGSTAQWSAAAQ